MYDDSARTVEARRSIRDAAQDLSAESLEDMERRLIALLYAIWRVQGVDKRIVKVEAAGRPSRENGHG